MNLRNMKETELKSYLDKFLEPDFFFAKEVKGTHIVEEVTVIADYILRPKSHLVENGFDDVYFAIEVKSPAVKHPNSQYRKVVVQAASYVDSLFSDKRPAFTLIFPDHNCFRPESNAGQYFEVHHYFHIAHYFNVGDFRINQKKDRWCIWFGGGRYYCSSRGKGTHNVTKRYVGNIS
ncbi:MAG: hypothetical protein AAFV93_21520 [Chloroflexota bacterium]